MALIFALFVFAAPARADIVVRLYTVNFVYYSSLWGQNGVNGNSDFPHAFIRFTGTLHDGASSQEIDETLGFNRAPSSGDGLFDYVIGAQGGVEDDSDLLARSTPYVSKTVSDAEYRKLKAMADAWSSKSSTYHGYFRNCMDFVGAIAKEMGLKTPPTTGVEPTWYVSRIARENPEFAMNRSSDPSPLSAAQLDAIENDLALRSAATWSGARGTAAYGSAMDQAFVNMSAYRDAARRTQISSLENVRRTTVQERANYNNYESARQAKKTAAGKAEIDAKTRAMLEKVQTQTVYSTEAGMGDSGVGRGAGGGSGSGGGGPGAPTPTPSPTPCGFYHCVETSFPPSGTSRFIGRARVSNVAAALSGGSTQGTPKISVDSDDGVQFSSAEGAAPTGRRQVYHLGNVLPGETYKITFKLTSNAQYDTVLATFASGPVTISMAREERIPSNGLTFRAGTTKTVQATVVIPNFEEIKKNGVPLSKIVFTSHDLPFAEIYIAYDLYPQDRVNFEVSSGPVQTGFGTDWGPWYAICAGPNFLGYKFESEFHGLTSLSPDHDRGCMSWGACSVVDTVPESGICFNFTARGHGRLDRKSEDSGFAYVADLRATYVLERPQPKWITPDNIVAF
ncbi:hypothetical protein [Novosphingobium sp.]|uniref:hypothetical protein n=1 Tax=Novosphingobium sp. TaxID=1874826 RepID=UPI003B521CBC